jgi:peroxiredoxin Q/BCP
MFSWLFSNPLPVGSPAPPFILPDQDGNVFILNQQRGKNVVLVFYPGDDTPVCRRQLCEFRDSWETVKARGSVVYGVNPQSSDSHSKFRGKYNLPFPLLVDNSQRVAKLYKAGGLVVRRTVYLIGKDGTIRFARRGKPSPEEVLAAAE